MANDRYYINTYYYMLSQEVLTRLLLSKVCLEDEGLPLSLGHPPLPRPTPTIF